MFLFLSGIGLWYSWVKTPSFKQFYKRRLLRIFPAWLIMSSLYYIPRFNGQTGSVVDLIGDITINWDFWLHDEPNLLVYPAYFDALPVGTSLYVADTKESLFQMAACPDDRLVRLCAVGGSYSSGGRTY